MEKAFEKIFKEVNESLRNNLEAYEKGTLPTSSKPVGLRGGGSIPFDFDLDASGNYHSGAEQYGLGVTVNCCAWIESPNASYTLKISSSDGGGGHWENVKSGQKINFNIQTSWKHSTKITVDGHANVTGQKGHGVIEYKY